MKEPSTLNLKLSTAAAINFVDTHCHIHDSEFATKYDASQADILRSSLKKGVSKLICVGTDMRSSLEALGFSRLHKSCFASLGIHPHEVANHDVLLLVSQVSGFGKLIDENPKVVALGECGLDYFYHIDENVRQHQKTLLRAHIELALLHNLPLIFHVRDPKDEEGSDTGSAFVDFFKILDDYSEAKVRGVVHSFSADEHIMEEVIKRGLYVGLNGIMTFTKQKNQLNAAKLVPLEKLLLETDAPFLTPAPFRGKMCLPEHLIVTAQFLATLRDESIEVVAEQTTANAESLFRFKNR